MSPPDWPSVAFPDGPIGSVTTTPSGAVIDSDMAGAEGDRAGSDRAVDRGGAERSVADDGAAGCAAAGCEAPDCAADRTVADAPASRSSAVGRDDAITCTEALEPDSGGSAGMAPADSGRTVGGTPRAPSDGSAAGRPPAG
jgi:hypothetical protein